MLKRSDFLSLSAELPREEVQVPDLGGSVWVRALTAGERDLFEIDHGKRKGADFRARLVVACACDDEGHDLFTSMGDVDTLSKLPCAVLDPVVTAAMRVNKFDQASVEDLEKNSGTPTTRSSGSPGDSPPTSAA